MKLRGKNRRGFTNRLKKTYMNKLNLRVAQNVKYEVMYTYTDSMTNPPWTLQKSVYAEVEDAVEDKVMDMIEDSIDDILRGYTL